MKNSLLIVSLVTFNSINSMQPGARDKVLQDRCLLQCALGALQSNQTNIVDSFEIDTPENRAATIEQFRMFLRNEAQLLANPILLCRNPQSTTPEKLHHSVNTHFKSVKINAELLEKWSRVNNNQTQISLNQLIDLISARLK